MVIINFVDLLASQDPVVSLIQPGNSVVVSCSLLYERQREGGEKKEVLGSILKAVLSLKWTSPKTSFAFTVLCSPPPATTGRERSTDQCCQRILFASCSSRRTRRPEKSCCQREDTTLECAPTFPPSACSHVAQCSLLQLPCLLPLGIWTW